MVRVVLKSVMMQATEQWEHAQPVGSEVVQIAVAEQ
jgi:hypothetical protein